MIDKIVNFNDKLNGFFHNPKYEFKSVSIMVYYGGDKASISYTGSLETIDDENNCIVYKTAGGFLYLPSVMVKNIKSKELTEFLKNKE